jgi:hypothetical protein
MSSELKKPEEWYQEGYEAGFRAKALLSKEPEHVAWMRAVIVVLSIALAAALYRIITVDNRLYPIYDHSQITDSTNVR